MKSIIKDCFDVEKKTDRDKDLFEKTKNETSQAFTEVGQFAEFKQLCWYDNRNMKFDFEEALDLLRG